MVITSISDMFMPMAIVVITNIIVTFHVHGTIDLGLFKLGNIGSAITHLPGCFCPRILLLNIGLNMSTSDSFISDLQAQLRYSTREFQAFQQIILVVFGAVY